MKRVVWISHYVTESEYDIALCRRDHPDLDIRLYCHEYLTPTDQKQHPRFDGFPSDPLDSGRCELLERLASLNADLYIFRYPYWIASDNVASTFHHLFDTRPAIAWASEQGPSRQVALDSSTHFEHIAVNNRHDEAIFRSAFPTRQILYLPFGCARHDPAALQTKPTYQTDLIADGTCHYACLDQCWPGIVNGTWKRQSVDTIVSPLLTRAVPATASDGTAPTLSLWGTDHELHGWSAVPDFRPYWRGIYPTSDYPAVYRSSKLYLGISWNWAEGGYGTKLARAMSTGIPILWHRTNDMHLDGLSSGTHLETTESPDETVRVVQELLQDDERRLELGRRGQEFALEYWEWGLNFKRLLNRFAY